MFLDYIQFVNTDYIQSLLLYQCLSWSLPKEKKKQKNTIYMISSWEIKAVTTFYQHY